MQLACSLVFPGSRKGRSVLFGCRTPPFQFHLSLLERKIFWHEHLFVVSVKTCATCLQAQGSPPCVPAHAHHMVTCTLCQADLLIAWGQGESRHREGRCTTKRLAAVTYLFISSFRLPVLSRRRRKGLGILQAVSWTQSVSYNYHHSFFSFFLFFGSPEFIILWLGEWGK